MKRITENLPPMFFYLDYLYHLYFHLELFYSSVLRSFMKSDSNCTWHAPSFIVTLLESFTWRTEKDSDAIKQFTVTCLLDGYLTWNSINTSWIPKVEINAQNNIMGIVKGFWSNEAIHWHYFTYLVNGFCPLPSKM